MRPRGEDASDHATSAPFTRRSIDRRTTLLRPQLHRPVLAAVFCLIRRVAGRWDPYR